LWSYDAAVIGHVQGKARFDAGRGTIGAFQRRQVAA
jgi:hypothetical protein